MNMKVRRLRVLKLVVKKEFNDYKRSLFGSIKGDIQQTTTFNTIRSYKHEVYTVKLSKIG